MTTARFLVVIQNSEDSLRAYIALNGRGIDDEKEELRVKSDGDEVIVAWYPLNGYLEGLGIFAEYSSLDDQSLGLELEGLLTELVRDIQSISLKKGGDDKVV